jgi:hypothetical protein
MLFMTENPSSKASEQQARAEEVQVDPSILYYVYCRCSANKVVDSEASRKGIERDLDATAFERIFGC